MIFRITLAVFLLLESTAMANPQWIQKGTPALGGRLRTMAVDPQFPNELYVGTTEGTILISKDGGEVWTERPVEPYLTQNGFFSGNRRSRIGASSVASQVRRIAICPGSSYRVMAALPSGIFGSNDGGVSFQRLFGISHTEEIQMIHCHPGCPSIVVAAGDRGLTWSTDGGQTFKAGPTPPSATLDVAKVDCAHGRRLLYLAQKKRLYRVQIDNSERLLEPVYPTKSKKGKIGASRANIADLQVRGDLIWLATDKGIQKSDDGGHSWESLPNDLGLSTSQVWLRPIQGSQEKYDIAHILKFENGGADSPAPSLNSMAFVSHDNGGSWTSLFGGLSQRQVRWVTHGEKGRWWLITSGGIWTTPTYNSGSGNEDIMTWAKKRLRRVLPLEAYTYSALLQARLRSQDLRWITNGPRVRCLLPTFDVRAQALEVTNRRLLKERLSSTPFEENNRISQNSMFIGGTLTWALDCAVGQGAELSKARAEATRLRSEILFAVQDAWHERNMLLQRISIPLVESHAAEILRSRVLTTEAVLGALSGINVNQMLFEEVLGNEK